MSDKKTDAWMPLWIGAYLADTQHLERHEHGAYFLLMMAYWRNGGPLLDDDKRLAAIAKATAKEWKTLRTTMAEFFTVANGAWSHKRIEHELHTAGANKANKESKSISGGAARWDSDAEERGRHLRSQRLAEARKKGTHNPMQWEAMKLIHQYKCVRCGLGGEMVKDHIQPIYQGGSDGIENIQPLCRKCNSGKGPESLDCRKKSWEYDIKNAFVEGIKCLPDACPTPTPTPSIGIPTLVAKDGDGLNTHSDACDLKPGIVCKAMKLLGVGDVNPGHADLLLLLAAGATLPEFEGAARSAVAKRKGFAYAIGIVKGGRKSAQADAQNLITGPLHQPQNPNRQEVLEAANFAAAQRFAQQGENHEVV